MPDYVGEKMKEYQSFISSLPLGAGRLTLGDRARFVASNQALLELVQYDSQEELFHAHLPFTLPKAKGGLQRERLQLQRSDGALFYAPFYLCPIFGSDENVLYFDLLLDHSHQQGEEHCNGEHKGEVEIVKRRLYQMRLLHTIALALERAKREEEIYRITVHTAETILGLSCCMIGRKKSKKSTILVCSSPIDERKAKSLLRLKEEGAALSIPFHKKLFFFASFRREEAFKEESMELVEILLDHSCEALKRIEHHKRIQNLSYYDSLTGLYNRRFCQEELKRLDKSRELPLSLIITDVNCLKLANDAFGHQEGDQLLKKVAQLLKRSCRREDIISRFGGDEFVILLPKTPKEVAANVCKRIKDNCKENGQSQVPLNMALGWATKEREEETIEDVLQKAEETMYRNKILESQSDQTKVLNLLLNYEDHCQEIEDCRKQRKRAAEKISSFFQLAEREEEILIQLINLHHLGHNHIPKEILKKPTPLDEKEWRIIKKHPEIGYRILKATRNFAHLAPVLLSHHEWWNGKGYPHGLKEEEIPFIARVFAILDAYVSMIEGSPYREVLQREEAKRELVRMRGVQFDPHLVDRFLLSQERDVEEGEW